MLVVLAAQAGIAAVDIFWVSLRHSQRLRMSRHDIQEEQKETEGDPRMKARIRQIRMFRARKRMLAAVPKATVVITNPTHYAVALSYDRAKHAAPRVVAKGVDSLAARIREVARRIACRWWPIRRLLRRCTGWSWMPIFRRNTIRRWLRSSPMSGDSAGRPLRR